MVDERASASVDRHPVVNDFDAPIRYFSVTPACHELTVTYAEDYVRYRESNPILPLDPFLKTAVMAGVAAAGSTEHHYKTETPIAFHVAAKPGVKYWITATFDGDQFNPRIVVLGPRGEHQATLLPDTPCDASAR
jgi:hypothetical protein